MRTEQEQLELYREQLEKEKFEYEQYTKEEQGKGNDMRTKQEYQDALNQIKGYYVPSYLDPIYDQTVEELARYKVALLQELIDNYKEKE